MIHYKGYIIHETATRDGWLAYYPFGPLLGVYATAGAAKAAVTREEKKAEG